MLVWLGILVLVGLILSFFYKQALHDFRVNQVDASQRSALITLWKENVPLVVRDLPRMSLWTRADVRERLCYKSLAIFQDQTLSQWIQSVGGDERGRDGREEDGKWEGEEERQGREVGVICPWREEQAQMIANVTGISIWAKRHIQPLFGGMEGWQIIQYYAWAGRVGCRRTYASWSCILPVEGDIVVTLFPETMEMYLPTGWKGSFPNEWTLRDTPFVGDIKYMDVIVRAGTCFFLPPHWFVSWTGKGSITPMVYSISYHTPVSWIAYQMSRGSA